MIIVTFGLRQNISFSIVSKMRYNANVFRGTTPLKALKKGGDPIHKIYYRNELYDNPLTFKFFFSKSYETVPGLLPIYCFLEKIQGIPFKIRKLTSTSCWTEAIERDQPLLINRSWRLTARTKISFIIHKISSKAYCQVEVTHPVYYYLLSFRYGNHSLPKFCQGNVYISNF